MPQTPKLKNFPLDLESLGGLIIRRLGLTADQEGLLQALLDNDPVARKMVFDIASISFGGGKRTLDTDLDDIDLSLTIPRIDAGLEIGFFPARESVTLTDFGLPELHRAQRAEVVPDGRIVCAVELDGKLGAGADAAGSSGAWTFALSASASLEARFRFYKELAADTGARDALTATLGAFSTPFHLVSRPPADGEVVVGEYSGIFKLGANLGYGWSTSGTKKLGTGVDNLELAAEYHVDAKAGVSADISLQSDLVVIVRKVDASWVNVSFMKQRRSERNLALNLNVDASLATRTLSSGQDVGDAGSLVDSLLGRTPLPGLMAELEKYDTKEEVQAIGQDVIDRVSDQVTGAVRDLLEGPVGEIDSALQPIRDAAAELIEAYQSFDRDVRDFLQQGLERVDGLAEIRQALQTVANAADVEALLPLLAGGDARADKIRKVLDIAAKVFDFDLNQLSRLRDGFGRIQGLAKKILAQEQAVLDRFETAYNRLQKQLDIARIMQRLEGVKDAPTLQSLLDEKIVWLENYLQTTLGKPLDRIADAVEPAIGALQELTSGYSEAVKKAQGALSSALNQEIGLQTSIAWQKVSSHQALISVDLDLDLDAGRDAMKDLLRGDLRDVMRDRLTRADAIRFQKSYLLDALRGSVSLRVVLNGREDLRISSFTVANRVEITPTENGEIWAQESSAITRYQRTNRRALVDVQTLFQFSIQELFERRGRVLESRGATLGGYAMRYGYHRELKDSTDAATVLKSLRGKLADISFQVVEPADLRSLSDDLTQVGELGPLKDVKLDIRLTLAPDALDRFFAQPDSESLRLQVQAAWDRAVHASFSGHPAMLSFYERFREDPGFPGEASSGLNRIDYNYASLTINSRGTFSSILRNLHHDVFQALLPGEYVTDAVAERLQGKLKERLKKLAQKMRWISGFEFPEEDERDFTMAIFANLVDESARSGSIAVSYTHPITGETMELRAADELPRITA